MPAQRPLPNTTLEDALVKLGFDVRCMWQKTGALEDGWDWLECLIVTGGPNDLPTERGAAPMATVIVQTFKDGNGWGAYVGSSTNSISGTIAEVMRAASADPMKHLDEIAKLVAA